MIYDFYGGHFRALKTAYQAQLNTVKLWPWLASVGPENLRLTTVAGCNAKYYWHCRQFYADILVTCQ